MEHKKQTCDSIPSVEAVFLVVKPKEVIRVIKRIKHSWEAEVWQN